MLTLDDEHLKDAVQTAANNRTTLSLLWHFIDKSGCFRTGLAKDDRQEHYNRGYGDFGLYIRSLLLEYAPEAYHKYIEEGVEENERQQQ